MSGHSKWSTIKRKKGAKDAARSKVWSRLAREIIVAAKQGGGDEDSNARLRTAVLAAKAQNMPNVNIDRAIKRGTGEIEGAIIEEINYEGYGVAGVAVLVETQTDNRNRTTSDVRHLFSKFGGNLGANGCVSYLFEQKGSIILDAQRIDMETAMDAAIEAGAEDVEDDGENIIVTTGFTDYPSVLQTMQDGELPIESSEIIQVPSTVIELTGKEAETCMKMVMAIDDLDDVSRVSANFDISDEEMAAIQENL
ncbi:YebC/PmpR family DNA-binding transcriptional regulator [bacterium]|jgi:YebC/PmpR family DNA-binding regulatory protein|nr:YebC/PmpR family DNA-binding transcriptional regulator [bacterium]MBT4291712.1 YebC/PmpR family DNA-binding transcriptional regulator [bacterium]MBT7311043.1 YebC/PmpR family DNA-binding transcriptional regulator [bacterium]